MKIGNTTLYHSDNTKVDLDKIPMVDAIITDPPYNISKENNFHTLLGRKGINFGDWDTNFNHLEWLSIYLSKLKKGGTLLIFCSIQQISSYIDYLEENGCTFKQLIRWVKTNPMPRNTSRLYLNDCEYCIWAVKDGDKWTFNKPEDKPYLLPEIKTGLCGGNEKTKHPTQKPLEVMEYLINIHTKPNDLILDPFMGSGSTGCASINLDRQFIGIEMDDEYYNIAISRIEKANYYKSYKQQTLF